MDASITFLLTPTCATLSINYVFASEEYPEFATGTINDVFGFVLSGPNPSGGNYNQTNIATYYREQPLLYLFKT
jgi:hypothetical protein